MSAVLRACAVAMFAVLRSCAADMSADLRSAACTNLSFCNCICFSASARALVFSLLTCTRISFSASLSRSTRLSTRTSSPLDNRVSSSVQRTILASERVILLSSDLICATCSSLSEVCSMCALLRKPKIPIEVININTVIAGIKYHLNSLGARCQFWCNQTVATILPVSSAPPMIITGMTAALNTAIKPAILYQAAMNEMEIAVTNVRIANSIMYIYWVIG